MDKIKLDTKFEVIENDYLNPQFTKAKCYVAYCDKNRNMSSISKPVFEKAIPSIFNIPVVGEWIEEDNDFGDHGGKIEIEGNDIKWVQTTRPYGVVPSDSNIAWEMVIEENGFKREYLTCSVILWTGRYPELNNLLDNQNWQSMEIEVVEGRMGNDKYYYVEEFIFSALCILGKEVTPCFEGSSIRFNLDKENFKSEFKMMLEELKQFTLNNSNNINNTISQKGGNLVEDNKVENIEQTQEVKDEFATVITTKSNEQTTVVETIDTDSYKVEETKIETTSVEVKEIVDQNQQTDNQNENMHDGSMMEDYSTEEVVVEEVSTNEEVVEIVEVSEQPIEESFSVLESEEYKTLENKFTQLEQQFNALVEENNKLKEFKAIKETEELKGEVDKISSEFALEEAEISDLRNKAYSKEISIEEYQEKLFALVGKKNFSKVEKVEKEEVEQPVTFSLKSTETCPYPSLSQYFQ